MNVNLRQIQALVSIARMGSFTKAANLLHLSQPALTMQIHHLEDALGMRLLDRNTRSVKLTARGREIVPVFEGVLQALDGLAINGAHGDANTARGLVSVAALPWVCTTLLAPLLLKFRKHNANIGISLRDASTQQVIAQVKAGEADFGIACVAEADPTLQLAPFTLDHLKVVFTPGHPLKHVRSVSLNDLAHYPLVAMRPGSSVRFLVDQGFRSMGQLPAPVHEVNHVATALGLVRAGLGISIVSAAALNTCSAARLASRDIRHPGFFRTISVMQKAGHRLSPAADSFLKFMLTASAQSDARRLRAGVA